MIRDPRQTDPWGIPYGGIQYNGHPCFHVNSPRDYLYMRALRFMLRIVSGWPGKELGEKLLFCEGKYHVLYNTGLSIVFFITQVWYLMENASSLAFFELGHMYVALLMNILSTSRGFTLCLSAKYRAFAVRFLTEAHVFYYKDKSDYSRQVYFKVHQISKWFSAYIMATIIIAVLLFNLVPSYINYRKGMFATFDGPGNSTYELSVYFKLPVDPERSFKWYCWSLALNWYASTLCATSIIMFDLFLSLIIFTLWGHFKILLYSLDTFPQPAAITLNNGMSAYQKLTVMYTADEQVEVYAKLKECILYHRFIVDFIIEMSNIFGTVLFIYYTFHQISGCLLLLECSQGAEAMARYLPLTIMMTAQLIQISIIFEIIGSMSEKLRDEVYCLPWEFMNSKNRKTVMLFLINVQEPVHVKAGGLVEVGVTTMAGILKTSFSYFAFLRTMSN